jgi:YtxH-like protein
LAAVAAVAATLWSWRQMKSNKDAMPDVKDHGQTQQEENAMREVTRCTGIGTTAFVAGLVAGVGTGLLFASQSGARTRRQLHNLAKDMQEEANEMLGDAKTSIGKVIEQGKSLVG